MAPDRETFNRIGIEDRIFLNVLGSLTIPIAIFVVSQIIVFFLGWVEHKHNMLRRLHRYLSLDGPLRLVIILFFVETYLDLFMGGLINTENDYLFYVPENWGPNGYLTFSDQFTVIIGNLFYWSCVVFPFIVIWVLKKKSRVAFMNEPDEKAFDVLYDVLYTDFKNTDNPFKFYYFVYMMRRIGFISVCFFMNEPH